MTDERLHQNDLTKTHSSLYIFFCFSVVNIIGCFLAAVVWLQHAIDANDPVLAGERLLEIVPMMTTKAHIDKI